MMKIHISKITKPELTLLMLDEALKEGWLYSENDVDFYYHYECNKIYAIKVNDELAGCLILHKSQSQFQNEPIISVGLFLVIQKYRNQKLVGPHLWANTITKQITKNTLVCFYSVPKTVHFYERQGYQQTKFVNLLYILELQKYRSAIEDRTTLALLKAGILRKIEKKSFHEIEQYNKKIFSPISGCGFYQFINQWMRRQDAMIIAYYEQDCVIGYGIATVCTKQSTSVSQELCYRLSPLYALSSKVAHAIVKAFLFFIDYQNGKQIILNTLYSSSTQFGSMLTDLGYLEKDKNYIVCNQPQLLNQQNTKLNYLYCSLPLEYPHEVVTLLA